MKYAQADKQFVLKGKGVGYYNCYCKTYSADLDDFYLQFCEEYQFDYNMKKYFSIFCSVILNVINFILEIYNKKLIDKIGYKTKSA